LREVWSKFEIEGKETGHVLAPVEKGVSTMVDRDKQRR